MATLSVRDLATITAGRIHLADLPPIMGVREVITSIHFTLNSLCAGSLFWNLQPDASADTLQAELSFMQGASGLLLDSRDVEPWAGRYTLRVSNAHLALRHLAAYLRDRRCSRVIAITPRPPGDPTGHYLESMLEPSAPRISWDPAEARILNSESDTLIELTEPIAAHENASLLLAGPQLLLTGHDDPFLTQYKDRHVIHQLLESLLPNGTLVFSELLNLNAFPATNTLASLPDQWARALDQTDITLFRIGPSREADIRITPARGTQGQRHLEVDDFFLPYTPATFAKTVARLTAYGVGRLLGQHQATLANRLGLHDQPPFRRRAA
jgi:hypothetical protein